VQEIDKTRQSARRNDRDTEDLETKEEAVEEPRRDEPTGARTFEAKRTPSAKPNDFAKPSRRA
jgi:hypothetical protein